MIGPQYGSTYAYFFAADEAFDALSITTTWKVWQNGVWTYSVPWV
jgi:hypothetical protein